LAKYDQGGGCPCGLYRECPPDCEHHKGEDMPEEITFDFGFTAVDEIPAQKEAEEASDMALDLETRLDKLHQAILPLLDNLSKNPESDYILWPNRIERIDAFRTHIQKIKNGEL
jgi:hypothetical protein